MTFSKSSQVAFDAAAQPLQSLRQEDGSYRFRLCVEAQDGSLLVSSPDTSAFRLGVESENGLVGVKLIADVVKTALKLNCGIEAEQVLFKRTGGNDVIHGADEFIGLAPAANYEMTVVCEAASSAQRFTKLPQKAGRGEQAVLRRFL